MGEGLRKNKRGSIQDILFIGVSLLAIAIVVLIVFKISNEINNELQVNPQIAEYDDASHGRDAFNKINDMYPGVIDNSFLFLVVGLSIVALVLAAMVRIHPAFFIFFLLVLIIIIFLCGVFSNIYQEIAEEEELTALADQLTFITNIMRFLPFIVGTMGVLLSIVMYKTWQNAY